MSPPMASWVPVVVGTAALITTLVGGYSEGVIGSTPEPANPLGDDRDYEWCLSEGSTNGTTNAKIIAVREKALTTYPSIPLHTLTLATKRIKLNTARSWSDPWTAAIFHTGGAARLILQTEQQPSRNDALDNLLSMLDDRSVGEYEWFELGDASGSREELELVRFIKLLTCVIYRHLTPTEVSIAVKREHTEDSTDLWYAGLWAKPVDGFVEEKMFIGEVGEFGGFSIEVALLQVRETLEKDRPRP